MELALSIGGTKIIFPSQIEGLNTASGSVGIGIIHVALNLVLLAVIILALFFIVFGGIRWITSQGDSKQVEEARNTIFYAGIGMFVAFLAMLVVNVLSSFLGIPLF